MLIRSFLFCENLKVIFALLFSRFFSLNNFTGNAGETIKTIPYAMQTFFAENGLSKKELSAALNKVTSLILWVPFLVAVAYLWIVNIRLTR